MEAVAPFSTNALFYANYTQRTPTNKICGMAEETFLPQRREEDVIRAMTKADHSREKREIKKVYEAGFDIAKVTYRSCA